MGSKRINVIGISGYVGPKKTGIGRVLENILIQLSKNTSTNYKYILFCNYDNHDFDIIVKDSSNIEKKVFRVSRNNSLLNLLWHQIIYPLRLFLDRAKLSYIPNVTLLMWKTVPTIVVIHDLIEFNVQEKFGKLRMYYRKFAVPLTAKRADHIITVSENSKKDIISFFGIEHQKISVIYNGLSDLFMTKNHSSIESVLRKYKIENPYLLGVGTIDHPGKNYITMVRSFKNISQEYPDQIMVLAGMPGHGFNKIVEEIDNLNLSDRIRILGYVPDEDLPSLYAGAKIFLFLSLYEGFGLPLIEAMSCGTPVIAANTSSLPEIVDDQELIVEPYDVNKISQLLRKLITDKNFYQRKVEYGISKSKEFSWKKAGSATIRIFKRFLPQ